MLVGVRLGVVCCDVVDTLEVGSRVAMGGRGGGCTDERGEEGG